MNADEERLQKMYGRLPSRTDLLNRKLKDRKFFDSGDYALKKAGRETQAVGSEHPVPESIPHHTSPPTTPRGTFEGGPTSRPRGSISGTSNREPSTLSVSPVKSNIPQQ